MFDNWPVQMKKKKKKKAIILAESKPTYVMD